MQELHYHDYYPTMEKPEHTALVVFGSITCGACRRIKTILQQQPLTIPSYWIEAASSAGLITEFSIFHLPTLILYKKGLFHRFFAPDLTLSLQSQINAALRLPSQEDPSCC